MNTDSSLSSPGQTLGRILIVDDVPINVRLLSSILEIEGYQVSSATNGPDALAAMPEAAPDVVLLDVMMPGMDGFEVCRRLKADSATAHVPVVMVTALQETSDRVRALEAGADDFLTKPVDDVEVLARVKSLVRVKRGRDELEKAYHDLQRAESMRDSIAEMLVHDLRTPLTAMLAAVDLLQKGYGDSLDEIQKELVGMCATSCRRMVAQVGELLDISKLESGALQLQHVECEAAQLVEEAVQQVFTLAADKALKIEIAPLPNLPLLWADANLLRRVLVNLLANSIKFGPRDSSIVITVAPQPAGDSGERALLFSVRDFGYGIPAADFERIFHKWGQAESRNDTQKISSGLGLTFCRLAVEAHGGRIWVESELEKGSTFLFTIPIVNRVD